MLQTRILPDEAATAEVAACLATWLQRQVTSSWVIYLQGDLAAGKTTFCRYFIQAMGHVGNVKSPTYTLVEPYKLSHWAVYHFDLYRLGDPEELEYMGIRDYFGPSTICLVEWPMKGKGVIPPADIQLSLSPHGDGRALSIELLSPAAVTAFDEQPW